MPSYSILKDVIKQSAIKHIYLFVPRPRPLAHTRLLHCDTLIRNSTAAPGLTWN